MITTSDSRMDPTAQARLLDVLRHLRDLTNHPDRFLLDADEFTRLAAAEECIRAVHRDAVRRMRATLGELNRTGEGP